MIFNRKNKVASNLPPDLKPCLSGKEIFSIHSQKLQDIRNQVSATSEAFEKTYLDTLYKVAEFCQSLPDSVNGENYSLLKQQLSLSETMLRFRKGLLLPPDAGAETMSRKEARWTYAFFSAGLLCQLSRIDNDRTIKLYNLQGEEAGIWHLYSGSLYRSDRYFKAYIRNSDLSESDETHKNYTPETAMTVLVTRLISPHIIHWISQNASLFNMWLETIITPSADNIISDVLKKSALRVGIEIFESNASLNFKVSKSNNDYESESKAQVESNNIFDQLLEYVYQHCSSKNEIMDYLRVSEGLLVSPKVLENFLMQHENIEPTLFKEDDHVYFTYSPVNFEDRRTYKGILIKNEFLDEKWQEREVEENFQRELINLNFEEQLC